MSAFLAFRYLLVFPPNEAGNYAPVITKEVRICPLLGPIAHFHHQTADGSSYQSGNQMASIL